MKLRYQLVILAFVVFVIGGIAWSASHYHNQWQKEKARADAAEHNLDLANAAITDMQTRQHDVAALDAKYIGELADAKVTIDQLQRDVDAGKRRLQLNATCPKSGTTIAGGMGDATSSGLTDPAERNYFTLRKRIETVTKQVGYLQDYIKEQCVHLH